MATLKEVKNDKLVVDAILWDMEPKQLMKFPHTRSIQKANRKKGY